MTAARHLLDTDAVIDVFKGVPSTVALIDQLYSGGDQLCTCDIVIAEVYSGLHPFERERGTLLIASLRFLSASSKASEQAGSWRYDFARRGRQLATTDCLIAAIALENGANVITGNVGDYPMEEVRLLPIPRQQGSFG